MASLTINVYITILNNQNIPMFSHVDSIVHDNPPTRVLYLPNSIFNLPKNKKRGDDVFDIRFEDHSVKAVIKSIDLRWGQFYDGDPYRNVDLNVHIFEYQHNSNCTPISGLTSAMSSHAVTTITVTQRSNGRDNGGHNGACMGQFSGIFCSYTGKHIHLPHIND
jgi:hypothetical protein